MVRREVGFKFRASVGDGGEHELPAQVDDVHRVKDAPRPEYQGWAQQRRRGGVAHGIGHLRLMRIGLVEIGETLVLRIDLARLKALSPTMDSRRGRLTARKARLVLPDW